MNQFHINQRLPTFSLITGIIEQVFLKVDLQLAYTGDEYTLFGYAHEQPRSTTTIIGGQKEVI